MKLGSMQPYFFPYLGYFDLINRVDRWVVFDTAQYIRHGWVNRNRILHPKSGWQYIILPLRKHAQTAPIRDIEVVDVATAKERIRGQLQHYEKRAPFFKKVLTLVCDSIHDDTPRLCDLNVHTLAAVCEYIGIRYVPEVLSQMKLGIEGVDEPGDWALRMAQAIGADEYINPPGGVELFNPKRFADAGIKLSFQRLVDYRYSPSGYQFQPLLSIIDVLMWNHPAEVKAYLDTGDAS